MKRIALFLAIVMMLAVVFSACGDESKNDTTTTADGSAATTTSKSSDTTTKANTTTAVTTGTDVPGPGDDDDDDDYRIEPLAKADGFKVDGVLGADEWKDMHTVSVIGDPNDTSERNSANKKVDFYACLTENGLYLACEAYHDRYLYEANTWWQNTNFEIFISSNANQYFAYGRGINNNAECSTNVDECAIVTEKIDLGTVYHSVAEVFISNDNLPEGALDDDHVIFLGVAWKTLEDLIAGGHCTAVDGQWDEYWVPKDAWPPECKLLAAPSGLYYMDDYYL